jgi:hypothetical protein
MRHLVALALVLLAASRSPGGVVTFVDGTFAPTDWEIAVATFRSSDGALADGDAQGSQAAEGLPSPSRRVELTLPPAPTLTEFSSTYAVNLRTGFVYDPMAQGSIASFDYEEDARILVAPVLTGLAVRQGGELYFAEVQVLTSESWTRVVRRKILQTNFAHLTPDGPVQGQYPDFSSAGAPIEVGFLRANSTGQGRATGFSNPALIDNWLVRVNPLCTEQADCDDGDSCGLEACVGGNCESTPLDCADADPCTLDTCAAGVCVNLVNDCNDGDACTTDNCTAGGVCQHAPVSCDDADTCTVDQCGGNGCEHTVVASTGLVEGRIDALLAIAEGTCAGEPLVKKFGKKLVKKLRKARGRIAAADAAARPAAIAKLVGKSEVLLAAADSLLAAASARGQVGPACAAELKAFLDSIRACAADL